MPMQIIDGIACLSEETNGKPTYEKILLAYLSNLEPPDYILCGVETFKHTRSYLCPEELGRVQIENAFLVPVPGMEESILQCVNSDNCDIQTPPSETKCGQNIKFRL